MVVNGAPAEPQSHALSEPAGECETLPTSTMCSVDAERDVSFDVMCTSCVMIAFGKRKRNTSHHCEQSEQHHYAARHNITCAIGAYFT